MAFSILIVDDSAITRALIKRTIQLCGLAVDRTLEAGDGSEALAVTRREHVDVILTDLNMPVMGGEALAQAILADPLTRHVPVVIVSADPNPCRERELLESGVQGFIRKPFTPEALRDALGRILGETHV